MARLERVAGQVARYIEHVWPKLERSGSIPEVPFDRKAKGESHAPVGDYALLVMGENWGVPGSKKRAVFQALRAELDQIESGGNNRKSKDGVPFSQILTAIRYDPGVLREWRKEESKGGAQAKDAFWLLCQYVAAILMWHFDYEDDPLELEVVVNPEDEQADSPLQVANREKSRRNNLKKTHEARDAYKSIYPKWMAFRTLNPEYTTIDAMRLFCAYYENKYKKEMSISKIKRAIDYCERGEFYPELKTLDERHKNHA